MYAYAVLEVVTGAQRFRYGRRAVSGFVFFVRSP